MIPVSLTLKNFLSYGDQVPTLDFTPLHVVCLSGDNGHGKSALLDAMTWAVWGEARKATGDRKPDERLLRMGTAEMAVEFEFDLEGDRYRILRQYRSGRGGKSLLEFQVRNKESDEYNSLTQPSITDTQKKIIETLRMDYKTFINSVFILQGRADEFTKRSARERKEILAEILGLWRYEELEDRAKMQAQQAQKMQGEGERRLQEIDETLEDRETCRQNITALKNTIAEIDAKKKEDDKTLNALQVKQAEFAHAARQLDELQTRYKGLSQEYDELAEQIDVQRKEVDAYQAALTEREEIEHAFRDYRALSQEYESLNQKLQALRQLEQRRTQIERTIEAARHEIEKQRQVSDVRRESIERTVEETRELLSQRARIEQGYMNLLRARQEDEQWEDRRRRHEETDRKLRSVHDEFVQARTALQSELGSCQHRLKDLKVRAKQASRYQDMVTEYRQSLEQLRQLEQHQQDIADQGRKINSHMEILKNKIKLYEHEDDDTNHKLKMLKRGASTNCPLCDAALDDRRRLTIEANLGELIKQHAEEIQKAQRGVKIAQNEKSTLTLRFKENRPKLEALPDVQQALAEAEAGVREVVSVSGEIGTLQKQIGTLQSRLESQQYAPEIQQRLAALKREQAEIGYDPDRHNIVKESLRDLQRFEGEKTRLDDADTRYKAAVASLPDMQKKHALLERQLRDRSYAPDAHRHLTDVQQEIHVLDYDEQRHQQVEHGLTRLKDTPARKEQLDQAVRQFDTARGGLNEREARVRKIKEEMTRITMRIKELEEGTHEIKQVEQQSLNLQKRQAVLQNDLADANRRIGAEQDKAKRYETLAAERPTIKQKRDKAARDAQIYEKLMIAFGKDGIQALIIENAIPEIEEEANRILSRLTGNQTQISIEPLRNLKTGGTKETLDIHISDEMGTRPYEMFSGGEAFRTNFALRIALSKLLAHRAGTRLRSLIIDEGFGTQDMQGLEYLIEALQGIQEDFEKIIVVTHLERLKSAFPARIEVTKYPDTGSQFEVIM